MSVREQIDGIIREIESDTSTQLFGELLELESIGFSEFTSLENGRVAAVDGSSVMVEPYGGLHISLMRSGYVLYDEKRLEKKISGIEVMLMNFRNSSAMYEEKYREILGEDPPKLGETDPAYMLQRMRTLEEFRYMFMALERLGEGDVLLIDGALRGDRHTPDLGISLLSELAQDRGVSLVGISKDSGIVHGSLPLIPQIERLAEERLGTSRWYTRIVKRRSPGKEEIYVVKFNPYSEHAFRTDIISLETTSNVLGKVAAYCSDVAYLGYPYPLADAHNQVIIRRGAAEDIGHMLEMDIPESFHRKLDRGV